MTLYGGGDGGSRSPPPRRPQSDDRGDDSRGTSGGSSSGGRAVRLLYGIGALWSDRRLTDVRIESQDGRVYEAHKAVLAAASEYFMAMFTGDMEERDRDHVVLKGVCAKGLEPLLEFVYTGDLALSEDNVVEIIAAASHLQLYYAFPLCIDFIVKALSIDNCVDIYNTAKAYQLDAYGTDDNIEKLSFEYICDNFVQVIAGRHHLRLSCDDLLLCLTGTTENGSDLVRFGPEKDLFNAMLEWRNSQQDDRPLNATRYALMTLMDLDEVSIVMQREGLTHCLQLVADARHYHSLAMHRQVRQAQGGKLQVRNRPCVVTLAKSNHTGAAHGDLRFFILSSLEGCPPPAQNLQKLQWLEIPKLDKSIHESIRHGFTPHAWESVNGFLVIYGETSLGHLRCYMLDSRTFLWSPMAMMNVPRTNAPLVHCDGDLFSLGGIVHSGRGSPPQYMVGTHSDVIERYSFSSGRWEVVGAMGEALVNHGACSLHGKIYMYGGRRTDGSMSRSMYTYEPSTGTWCEHRYRFAVNDNPVLCVLLDRIYTADPAVREMAYYTAADHCQRHTWWGVLMRERHLVPVNSLHAVFLPDSVFFLNGILQPESNISNIAAAGGSSSRNKCTQVTVHKNRSVSGHPIPQPDYPAGWTPCVAAALSLPWDVVRDQAKPIY